VCVCVSLSGRIIPRIKQELGSSCYGRSFGHNRRGPKSGGCCAPFRGWELGPPSNTMWPGRAYLRTKWHLDPSDRLPATIHQRYRQTGQRSRSIGRTVTCNSRPMTSDANIYNWHVGLDRRSKSPQGECAWRPLTNVIKPIRLNYDGTTVCSRQWLAHERSLTG